MLKKSKIYDLEDRLMDFAVRIKNVAESLPKTVAGNHISRQLIRCCTSPALNYHEAQSAMSRSDFIRRIKICHKDLHEITVWLQMVKKDDLISTVNIEQLIDENNQLISIFLMGITSVEENQYTSHISTRSFRFSGPRGEEVK